jgi:rSAM/selenodomain-associated transferase 1
LPNRARPIRDSRRRLPAVGVFARAPQPGRAKTRLVPVLGRQGAADFQAALLTDTIRKVETLSKIAARWLFGAGGSLRVRGLARGWKAARQRGRDLGTRLDRAFRQLLALHPAAVVIGTDSPLLEPRTLREALRELRACDAVLGPCPDGGFYLIGLRCLPRGLFRGVRWSSRFAFRDVLTSLSAHGLITSVLPPLADVDRPADLLVLAQRFFLLPAACRLAPATWDFVKGRMPTT